MKTTQLILIFLLIILLSTSVSAQEASGIELLGQVYTYWHEARGITIADDIAYLATYQTGMQIIDVSNPAEPRLLGTYDSPGQTREIAVSGEFAYLADDQGSLRIVDVSDPTHPRETSFWRHQDHNIRASAIVFRDDVVFMMDENYHMIRIIDVSDPANPEYFGEVSSSWACYSADFLGDRLFVSSRDEGLVSFDVSNPQDINAIRNSRVRYDTQGYVWDVKISDGLAYIADGEFGMRIINIEDPQNPEEIGFYDTPGNCSDISIEGGFAYLIEAERSVLCIDISDPENPEEVGYFASQAKDVQVSDDFVYVAARYEGLKVADVANPAEPEIIGMIDRPNSTQVKDVAISGNYAYIADESAGLWIIDYTVPEIVDLHRYDENDQNEIRPHSVLIVDDVVFTSGGHQGTVAIDISDPENPQRLGRWGYPCRHMDYQDGIICGTWSNNLYIMDYSNPQAPQGLLNMNLGVEAFGVDIVDETLFIAGGDGGTYIYDISNPRQPQIIANQDQRWRARDVAISGDYAYIADDAAGLRIVDVSDIENPEEVGDIRPRANGSAVGVEIVGNFAYVSQWQSGIVIVDVTDPQNPEEIGFYDTPGNANNLAVMDQYAFVADWTNFAIYDCSEALAVPVRDIEVAFREGWNMISINVVPQLGINGNVIEMMQQLRVDEDNHHVILMKDSNGRFYAPAWDFNSIRHWNLDEGYKVKVDEEVVATWDGIGIPAQTAIHVEEGWNLVAFYPTYQLDASREEFYVLSSIIDNVILARDENGRFLYPAEGFSNMPAWRPSRGYQIWLSEDADLVYPEEQEERDMSYSNTFDGHWTEPLPGDENMSLLVNLNSTYQPEPEDQVAAFNQLGQLIGVGKAIGNRFGVAVWGDDPITEYLEGVPEGEQFEIRLWSDRLNREFEIEEQPTYKARNFVSIDATVNVPVPEKFYLTSAFPNPFNARTKISYGIPEVSQVNISILDVTGRIVAEIINGKIEAGHHTATWNGSEFSSGVYLVNQKTATSSLTTKATLVK
ncbi:MAG: T9SS type A sorting domain-containing protein [Calditrichaeota bacterium]|nr:T9SS type A sorting domain-containing protein [Calditrichota bacterium]